MSNYIQSLEPDQKITYFQDALPTQWFTSATDKLGLDGVSEAVRKAGDVEEQLEETCTNLLFSNHLNSSGGTNFLREIAKVEHTSEEMVYSDHSYHNLLYYKIHFLNNRKGSQIVKFTDLNTEELFERIEKEEDFEFESESEEDKLRELMIRREEFNKAFSKFGSDIWNLINEHPSPNVARIDWPYLVIELYVEGGTRSVYDERTGQTYNVRKPKKLAVRFDFDNQLAELQGHSSLSEAKINTLKEKLETLFFGNIDLDDPIEITDSFIRYMDNQALENQDSEDTEHDDKDKTNRIPEHRGSSMGLHEGRSRSRHSGDNIHEDDVYEEEILDRDHIEKSIDYEIDNLEHLRADTVKINFSKSKNLIQIYRTTICPLDRRRTIQFIVDRHNDYQEEVEAES